MVLTLTNISARCSNCQTPGEQKDRPDVGNRAMVKYDLPLNEVVPQTG